AIEHNTYREPGHRQNGPSDKCNYNLLDCPGFGGRIDQDRRKEQNRIIACEKSQASQKRYQTEQGEAYGRLAVGNQDRDSSQKEENWGLEPAKRPKQYGGRHQD